MKMDVIFHKDEIQQDEKRTWTLKGIEEKEAAKEWEDVGWVVG